MLGNSHSKRILEICRQLLEQAAKQQVITARETGDDELTPTTRVMDRCHYRYGRHELEINLTYGEAMPPYEWLVELSFREDPSRHYLVRSGWELVEAYGRRIYPVDQEGALALTSELERLL
jgi:hypothetical protein